jgi:hypothetical protein
MTGRPDALQEPAGVDADIRSDVPDDVSRVVCQLENRRFPVNARMAEHKPVDRDECPRDEFLHRATLSV